VEVQRERLIHLVLHEEPNAIARVDRDQRPGNLAVERHRIDDGPPVSSPTSHATR
jgi:hypothetical protein